MPSKKPAFILIVGATAVGKTQLAIELAERLDERAFMNVYN